MAQDVNIEELKEGVESAWKYAYPVLFGVAKAAITSKTGRQLDGVLDDLASEAIVAAMKSVKKVETFGMLKAYTAVCAKNRALESIRKHSAKKRGTEDDLAIDGCEDILADTDADTREEALMQCAEFAFEINRALDRLSVVHKNVILGKYYENLSYEEIAQRYGLDKSNVGVQLNRAKAALKNDLGSKRDFLKEVEGFLHY